MSGAPPPPPSPPPPMPPAARIYEGGYQHYTGVRLGVRAAVLSVARHGFRSLLGIRRGVFAKLVTIGTSILAYAPAMIFLGLSLLIPQQLLQAADLPTAESYLGFVLPSIILFVSLSAPVTLCPDRRTGAIALYLASPLDRTTYLLGRGLALVAFLALVTIGPPLFLLTGNALLGVSGGALEFTADAARAIGAGLVMSVMFAAVAMALASLTDRQASAAGFTILFMIGSQVATGILLGALDLSPLIGLGNVVIVALEAAIRINGGAGGPLADDASTLLVTVATLAWIVVPTALLRWRYQRVAVTR